MTAPPLTIRNLTSLPLSLKLVERYPSPDAEKHPVVKHFGNFTANLTNFVNSTTPINLSLPGPSAKQLAEHAQSFERQDVDVKVEPWKSVDTGVGASERGEREVLRLTVEVEGERYR